MVHVAASALPFRLERFSVPASDGTCGGGGGGGGGSDDASATTGQHRKSEAREREMEVVRRPSRLGNDGEIFTHPVPSNIKSYDQAQLRKIDALCIDQRLLSTFHASPPRPGNAIRSLP